MRILLTGGAGYIGRIMIRQLSQRGDQVRVLDSMIYGNHVDQEGPVEVFNCDINDTPTVQKALHDVDMVIHMAAIVGDPACDLDPERAVKTNYLATGNLARLCQCSNTPLVFFSTCSVYGVSSGAMLAENGRTQPLSIYAKTKLAAEDRVRATKDHLIVRLGTVFGVSPRMRFDLVVNRMIGQALLKGEISVFGGEQFRPFIHVNDIVSNVLKAIDAGAIGTYNLAGKNYRIREIGDKIGNATRCKVSTLPEQRDHRDYAVDSGRAERDWGAKFPTTIDSAVEEIGTFIETKSISSCEEPIYNNANWLRTHDK